MRLEPSLHKTIPLNTRVSIPLINRVGLVVGISSMHVIFHYIVLLDEEYEIPEGKVKAVAVSGTELWSEDGKSNWRLEN